MPSGVYLYSGFITTSEIPIQISIYQISFLKFNFIDLKCAPKFSAHVKQLFLTTLQFVNIQSVNSRVSLKMFKNQRNLVRLLLNNHQNRQFSNGFGQRVCETWAKARNTSTVKYLLFGGSAIAFSQYLFWKSQLTTVNALNAKKLRVSSSSNLIKEHCFPKSTSSSCSSAVGGSLNLVDYKNRFWENSQKTI